MAYVTIRNPTLTEGETVTAYPASNWSMAAGPPAQGSAAVGSSVGNTGVVTGGVVTLTNLPASTDLYARGGTSAAYVRFKTPAGGAEASFGDSLSGGATTAAPAAGATLAACTPPPGVYRIRIILALTGTAEPLANNARVILSGVAHFVPTISGQVVVSEIPRMTIASGNATLSAVAAATAGSVYTASIVCTRVE